MSALQLNEQSARLLQTLMIHPDAEFHGLELAELTGVLPGTSYPILLRLHQAGWITARWDSTGPRRRLYGLARSGLQAAAQALAQYQGQQVTAARNHGWCPA